MPHVILCAKRTGGGGGGGGGLSEPEMRNKQFLAAGEACKATV